MLLALDVGNTNIMMGVYAGEELISSWRLSTDRGRTADEYAALIRALFGSANLDLKSVTGVVISSVVPPMMMPLNRFCERYLGFEPVVVGPGTKTGMDIRFDDPREVGADRIVNGVAAYHRYGGPVIVVDFGTATTFDFIDENGAYLGGAIAPGIGISTEALFDRASRLPRVDLVRPPRVIGRNTVHSMQSGFVYGFAGQVDALVMRIAAEAGPPSPRVVATGGLARIIAPECRTVSDVDSLLTLEGLRLVYERNRCLGGAPEKEEGP